LNSRDKNLFQRAKSYIRVIGINFNVRYFSKKADGVFLVGNGLHKIVANYQKNILVGTASWIKADEIIKECFLKEKFKQKVTQNHKLKLCIATRLEYMKGVHIAIDALGILKNENLKLNLDLVIYGDGEEKESLINKIKDLCLSEVVKFGGVLDYPSSFYNTITDFDLMLLTNLNDEQSRLIFDSISQGVIPICPNSLPYQTFKLNKSLMYKQGCTKSLASLIQRFLDNDEKTKYFNELILLANNNTVESMHNNRADWIEETIKNKY
jgi:glycosyltransferase involved in cell wall biosynthesis